MPHLTLIILRHGDSPSYGAERDHARGLSAQGRAQAKAIGVALAAEGLRPSEALCSDAQRTQQTWAIAAEALPSPLTPTLSRALYLADLLQMREAMEQLEGHTVGVIVGHNPGVSQLVGWLSGERLSMGTATAVILSCEAEDWRAAADAREGWRLVKILRPD
ncbi:histidine phosphatase family protein [Myxococcota bacterium]|nr:histidine phosphatase family protein [Myxococcota bacterium]MBU1430781.1 histidine phosphatase family protein [Myxococcota bacterium]MBU1900006.1 histidine phosphatase family protein [Myxococcota bacterium]